MLKGGSSALSAIAGHTTGLVVDALDEARARVGDVAFNDFLADVKAIQEGLARPIVLFCRTTIVEDCWLWLATNDVRAPILDIQYFGKDQALKYVAAALQRRADVETRDLTRKKRVGSSSGPLREKAEEFITKLALASDAATNARGGLGFAGYAPVLEAIAAMLYEVENPGAPTQGKQKDILFQVVDSILTREYEDKIQKLLPDIDESARIKLGTPDDQRNRLIAVLWTFKTPELPPEIPAHLQPKCDDTIRTFIATHPFLIEERGRKRPSSIVFSAELVSYALRHLGAEERRAVENSPGEVAGNPLLIDFFERYAERQDDLCYVAPEHVGLLDASMRARLEAGQQVELMFFEDKGEQGDVAATVEISRFEQSGAISDADDTRSYWSTPAGTIRLTNRLARVDVDAESSTVEIGNGDICELSPPVYIHADKLTINAREVSVSRERPLSVGATKADNATKVDDQVWLSARTADVARVGTVPRVFEGVRLVVSWPGARVYPWTAFAGSEPKIAVEPNLAEAQRQLRRLLVNFRASGYPQPALFRKKLENKRFMKNLVEPILNALLRDGIVSLDGNFYVLHLDRIGAQLRTDFNSLKTGNYGEGVNSYLLKVLEAASGNL